MKTEGLLKLRKIPPTHADARYKPNHKPRTQLKVEAVY
jgi:hypothetical protein